MEPHGEKRPAPADQTVLLDGVKGLLVDVEGTTTPVSFTKEVLVPYTKENLRMFIESNYDGEEVQQDIEAIRKKMSEEKEAGVEGVTCIPDSDKEAIVSAIVSCVLSKLDTDIHCTALRPLIERVWKEAYRTDCVQGEVYDDVVPVLRQVVSDGMRVCSYSTDSVDCQKLLFAYSNQGDILEIFSNHFDLSVGSKKEKESYVEIAKRMELPSSDILYLTHSPQEASAASLAGMKTCLVVREGSESLSDEQAQSSPVIYGLDELLDDLSDVLPSKRPHSDYHYDDYVSTDGATNDSDYPAVSNEAVPRGNDEGDDDDGEGEAD